jgi:hypothetical protein
MSKAGINRNLPNDAYEAATNANNPNNVNVFATLADIVAGQGNIILSGGVVTPTGTGLTYDITAATYIIQGTVYNSPTDTFTLSNGDATFDRKDVIALDDTGNVVVIEGTPSASPVKPQVDSLTQVEATFITVPAGATSIPATTELIYDENAQVVGGEWDTTTTASVNLADTANPYNGTIHIGTTGSFGTNKNITFDQTSYTLNGGVLTMRMSAKVDMTSPGTRLYVGFFVGGSLVGNSVSIGGTASPTFGFDGSIVGSYQLIAIPIASFGGLPASIDELRIFTLSGANASEFDLDYIRIIEGIPTPPENPIYLNDLEDVVLDFDPDAGVQDDDGKLLYYDTATGKFITNELVNHTSRVINAKKGPFPGTISKGQAVYLTGYDSDLHTVELAAAGDVNKMPVVGIAGEPMNNTDEKHVVIGGLITGLDTSGAVSDINPGGETWVEGDILYMSITPGGLTNVRPTGASVNIQEVAKVVDVSATAGKVLVMDSHLADLPNITQNSFWVGDANSQPQENTPTQVTALLNLFTSALKGLVPASGGGTTNFLRADGSWAAPAGGGSSKFAHTTYAYDFVGASGTWNGNTIGAVGSTEYDDRWRVASFAGTGQPDGFYINFRLDNQYTAGTNIRVEFDFATLVGAGGGNAHFAVGLCEPETVNNNFGSETTTTYITQDIAVQPGDRIATYSATFSGTNLEPGDQISILVYRDPGNAGDTNNETLYVSTILIEEV